MNYLSKIGFVLEKKILFSLIASKYLQLNNKTIPNLKSLKIIFPLFDANELTKSKLLLIILNFLEEISGCKPKITHAKILIKKGVFFRCQLILNKSLINKFINFLNDFLLSNSLLKFTTKL